MVEISARDKSEHRIYPAIRSCISNRYKIVAGIFSVYAFIASSLNADKEIIGQDVSYFVAWVFTVFVLHNLTNYIFIAWEQYDLKETPVKKLGRGMRIWNIFRVEGFFSIVILAVIWIGYFFILRRLFATL